MLEINDTVICIDDSIKPGMEEFVREAYYNWIKRDVKYTIREFLQNEGIVVGVLLNEVHNFEIYQPLIGKTQEVAFRLDRFKKIESATKEEYFSEKNSILEDEFIKI